MSGSGLLAQEPAIRLVAFCAICVLMGVWEVVAPRREMTVGRRQRWPANLGIIAIDTLLVRVVVPMGAVGVALAADAHSWGLFQSLGAPAWVAIPLSIVALDLTSYLLHVLYHAVPMLWRVHRMHHADLDFDFTTGVRFHPFEILLSVATRLGVVAALGAPAIAVLIFEIVLNATSVFNHSNARLPLALDATIRWVLVTPDVHRVHHSIVPRETNSNFGFNLTWWDRLFGTYRVQPEAGHQGMTIGIAQFRDPLELRLLRTLAQPFRRDEGVIPLGNREPESNRSRG